MNKDTVRALLAVFEAGSLNSDQNLAIHNVRVLLGDAEGVGCAHENTAYEAGDALVCQDCREVLPSPDAAPPTEETAETVAADETIEAPAVEVEPAEEPTAEERKVRCPSCHRYTGVPFGTTEYACSRCGEKLEITE